MYRRLQMQMPQFDLSVLILSVPERFESYLSLYKFLKLHSANYSVQIVGVTDNYSMTVGEKRNLALSMAKGTYVSFIDDDDTVEPDYVKSIIDAMEGLPDVITFNVDKTTNGANRKLHKYYKGNGRAIYLAPDRTHYRMLPNHLCAWKRDIITEAFPKKNLSEDHLWAEVMVGKYDTVHNIDKVLYHYKYDTKGSKTHPK